jgi:hypothetical protein
MHRSHLRLCGLGILAAAGFLIFTGGSASGVGLLIAALLCPLAMILAMSVLMGPNHQHEPTTSARGDDPARPVDQP